MKEVILRQLELACLPGGESQIKSLTTQTGVKDSLANSVIDQVLQLGKELRRKQIGRPQMKEEDIQRVLKSIVQNSTSQGGVNPLLSLPGRFTPYKHCHSPD